MATLVQQRIAIARPAVTHGLVERARGTFAIWARRMEERRALAQFDWREMKDIAISEADIQREIAKPFWRA